MQQAPWQFVETYYSDDLKERESKESKWFLSWLKEVRGNNVLCLGCGPNFYDDAQFFGEIPDTFVGIDYNENNIAFLKSSNHPEINKCKKLLLDSKTKIQLYKGDITQLKKSFVNRFDAVYAIGVLGMFKENDTIQVFNNIRSYLKPNGILLDIDWTDCRLSANKLKERERFGWYNKNGAGIEKIGVLLENDNFKIIKHKIYKVPNAAEYGWGIIYGYLAKK